MLAGSIHFLRNQMICWSHVIGEILRRLLASSKSGLRPSAHLHAQDVAISMNRGSVSMLVKLRSGSQEIALI